MSRQLFLHHYLPSHLASTLVAGAVLHFLISDTVNTPISARGHFTPLRNRNYAEIGLRGPIITAAWIILLLVAFLYISPLTYGTPG
jgi:dolichyl-phosphate-mannose-protein mannosyltransferase